jgi:hypothetical protein
VSRTNDFASRRGLSCVAFFALLAGCGGGGSGDGDGGIPIGGGPGATNPKATRAALDVEPHSRSVVVDVETDGAGRVDLYYASQRGFDPDNWSTAAGGKMLANVQLPVTITGLENGRAYYFVADVVSADGSRVRAAETSVRPNHWLTDDAVRAQAFDAAGNQYLGGVFGHVGVYTGSAVAVSTADGTLDATLPVVDGATHALVPDGHGGWYVGGSFERVGGLTRRNLARVLPNGEIDPNWAPQVDGTVTDVVVAGGIVYVVGQFTTIDGQSRTGLAALDVGTGQLTGFAPTFGLAGITVRALAVSGDTIYVAGPFDTVNGAARHCLAAIGTDGTVRDDWQPRANDGCHPTGIAVHGDTVYVGGWFNAIDSQPRSGLAAIGTDGTLRSDWVPDPGTGTESMAVSGDRLYVVGGLAVAAVALDGTGQTIWRAPVQGELRAMTVADGMIYVGGGWWFSINGVVRAGAAALGTDGVLRDWNPRFDSYVLALAVAGNTVYAGGLFTTVNAQPRSHLASLDAHGTLRADWTPELGGVGDVYAFALAGDTVYVGGTFSSVDGQPRGNLAAVRTDGTLRSDWSPISSGSIHFLAASNGTAYAAGPLAIVNGQPTATINGQPSGGIAAIRTDGTLRTDWAPSFTTAQPDNPRLHLSGLVVHNDTVYLSGLFTAVDGQSRNGVAAVREDGTLRLDWTPVVEPAVISSQEPSVSTIAAAGNTVYIGGRFTSVDGSPRAGLAAVGTNGALRTDWAPNLGVAGLPLAFAATADGVYVAGTFNLNGTNRLFAVRMDQTVRSDWAPYTNLASGYVINREAVPTKITTLTVVGDTVHLGGDFRTVNGEPRGGFAALGPDGALR